VTSAPAAGAGRALPWLVVAGVLVAALSLRGPIMSPTPVMTEIEGDFGIGSGTAGLLTTAPVLMFALLTPIAALVIRRAGAEVALLIALSGVLVGTFVRALPGFGWMLAGMVVIGASITIGNVVIPVIIRRDVPPERVALVTAAYAATLNVGSLLTSLLTAPLAEAIGWSWALMFWSLLTFGGIGLWSVHMRRARARGAEGSESGEQHAGQAPSPGEQRVGVDPAALTGPLPVVTPGRESRAVFGRPVAWLLVAAFGLQCAMYYALSTWLPTFASDELGLDAAAAGAIASIYQGVGIVGAFVVPLLLRFTPRIVAPLVICASWLIVTTGVLLAPELLWVWLSVGAIGHAGGFVVVFSALVAVSKTDAEAAGMSAFVQGGGYAIGALGAPVMGALYEQSGQWSAALAVLVVLAVVYCAALLAAVAASRRASH
jgi:CP family cyanate transporter-like MFS transporter